MKMAGDWIKVRPEDETRIREVLDNHLFTEGSLKTVKGAEGSLFVRRPRVYVAGSMASRARDGGAIHVARCVQRLGYEITYRWWEDDTSFTWEKARADLTGIDAAGILVAVFTHDDVYRGTYVEIGYALSKGKHVYVLGEYGNKCIFLLHPNVHRGYPPEVK